MIAADASAALDLADLQAAARTVHAAMPPTPQYRWPLLEAALGSRTGDGTEVWVKHENHTPVGAFKLRGGLVFFDRLMRRGAKPAGVVSATRGNHGQSIASAARAHGVPALIVVPLGNSREKNAAMRALGAELGEAVGAHGIEREVKVSIKPARCRPAERAQTRRDPHCRR